jgi:hypothetical protein
MSISLIGDFPLWWNITIMNAPVAEMDALKFVRMESQVRHAVGRQSKCNKNVPTRVIEIIKHNTDTLGDPRIFIDEMAMELPSCDQGQYRLQTGQRVKLLDVKDRLRAKLAKNRDTKSENKKI